MRTFNPVLTRIYKSIIVKNGLVQSGALRDSVKVYLFPKGKVMQIIIVAIDYHKFLVEEYNLIPQFTDDQGFGIEVSNAFEFYIEKRVEAMLNGEQFSDSDLDLSLSIELEYSFGAV